MLRPGEYAYYTRSNGVRVVACIDGSSALGEEFRTITYSRPSAQDPGVKVSVTNDCARIDSLEAVRGRTPPTPGTNPSSIKSDPPHNFTYTFPPLPLVPTLRPRAGERAGQGSRSLHF